MRREVGTSSAVLACLALCTGCPDTPKNDPVVQFSASPTEGRAPLQVTFQDLSNPADAQITDRIWDFGDGATGQGSVHVTHLYKFPGAYPVVLTLITTTGTFEKRKIDYIVVAEASGGEGEGEPDPEGEGNAEGMGDSEGEGEGAVPPQGGEEGEGESGTIPEGEGEAIATRFRFVEISVVAGVSIPSSESDLSRVRTAGAGAVGDFNGDGFQDILMIGGCIGECPDRLYINQGDGTFSNDAEAWGLNTGLPGKAAAVGDYDADGWLDVFVSNGQGAHMLYHNESGVAFRDVAAEAGLLMTDGVAGSWFGAAFGDYDLDGDLDLFVAGNASRNAGSRLFRNDGDGTFTDVTTAIGLFDGVSISMVAYAPRFADMDGDRYPELLIAADFGTSRYFLNNRDGTFTDITEISGTGHEENGMGQAIGDFNGNGLLDWYVTSIYNLARNYTGNKLYLNQGDHRYTEVGDDRGVHDGGWGWGVVAADLNHDGRLDIASAAGQPGHGGEFTKLWIQREDGRFLDEAQSLGFDFFGTGRGVARFDLENDGDQDLLVFPLDSHMKLFRNELQGPGANWLRVFLDTSARPGLAPNGYGARVLVTAGGATYLRYLNGGDNFETYSELSAHFGLGTAEIVSELRVEWPDATTTVMEDLPVNQTITVHAP